mmetsp:Transcript_11689/g.19866  ORF Transcript_11689/g.19866 Transcript_11689/m.19866 type:complete len:332 (+) Transcript_11689:2546-3541(+)
MYLSCCNSLQKFIALKRGWKIEDILRPKSHSTVTLPPFTEQDYLSQFSNTTNFPSTFTSSSSSTNMRMQTDPTSGLPEIIDMNRIVDDIRVSYYLGIRLDAVGRAVVSSPWSYLFYLLPRAFKKDGKLSDGLVIFYKASNQVDLTFNAGEVATVAKSKKGVILKEADRFDPEFIVQMGNDLVDDTDCFGTSTQAADLCKAMEQQVKEFNKRANIVSYYIDFLDFPYNLTPGTYQWEHTSDIAEDGLSSRLLEIGSGEAGYFIVVGIEDQEGEDDLVDKEPEDVRANARKKAEERMRNRRKSAGAAATAGRSTVDDIADDLSSLKFGKFRRS